MLLLRGDVAQAALLPVHTFGSPSILCGGDHLLEVLQLPKSHVQQVMMHRDLVPRAFSCTYPDTVAEVLRRMSSAIRDHTCLTNQVGAYERGFGFLRFCESRVLGFWGFGGGGGNRLLYRFPLW